MIVCICRAKNDREVGAAIEAGAASLRELQRCGIGTDCGSCHEILRMMLADCAAEPAMVTPQPPVAPATLAPSA